MVIITMIHGDFPCHSNPCQSEAWDCWLVLFKQFTDLFPLEKHKGSTS